MLTSEKILPLTKGIIKKFIIKRKHDARTEGTDDARYCYAVWMRHLKYANRFGFDPEGTTIAELGPGDSLGIGLAGLISGCKKYHALDVIRYWNLERNLSVFDQLVKLFRERAPVPDDVDFPKVVPMLDDYRFPSEIFTERKLKKLLAEDRISKLREEIIKMEEGKSDIIRFFVPWQTNEQIEPGSIDFLFSQAVLAYVQDLDLVYKKFNGWLKAKGMMSHTIDFSSHGITRNWNAQWTFSEREWKIAHGNSHIILNRATKSKHLALNYSYGFDVLLTRDVKKENKYGSQEFDVDYRKISDEDAKTFASFILSRKIRN